MQILLHNSLVTDASEGLRRYGLPALKFLFAAGLLWLIWRHGLIDVGAFTGLTDHPYRLAAAFLACSLLVPITTFRWYLLLNGGKINFKFRTVLLINYIGIFYNTVLPGGLGGEVFKSVIIFRHSETYRVRAVLSVIVDRVCGLLGLLIVCALGILIVWDRVADHPLLVSLSGLVAVGLALGFGGLVLTLTLHGPLRSLLQRVAKGRSSRTVSLLLSVVDAISHYRGRVLVWPVCIGLSVVLHLSSAVFLFVIAPALELAGPQFGDFVTALSMANFANLVPITPGGLGIGEAAYGQLIVLLTEPGLAGAATFQYLLLRATWVLISLPGAAIYIMYGKKK